MSEGEAKTSTPTEVFEQLCDQKSGVRWMMMELGPKSKSLVLVSNTDFFFNCKMFPFFCRLSTFARRGGGLRFPPPKV